MEDTLQLIRAVLISVKGPCTLTELEKDYRTLTGSRIPYTQLGFSSLDKLLNSCPTLKVFRDHNGVMRVEAKETSDTKHMSDLVRKQRNSKKKSRSNAPRFCRRPSSRPIRTQPRNVRPSKPKKTINVQERLKAAMLQRQTSAPSTIESSNQPTRNIQPHSSRLNPQLAKHRATSQQQLESVTATSQQQQSELPKQTQKSQPKTKAAMTRIQQSEHNVHRTPTLSKSAIQQLANENNGFINQNGHSNLQRSIPASNQPVKRSNSYAGGMVVKNSSGLQQLEELATKCGLGKPVKKIWRAEKAGICWICSIKLDNKSYTSYPRECVTAQEAENEAIRQTYAAIEAMKLGSKDKLLMSTVKDVLERIPPIINKYGIVWMNQLALDYVEQYNEQLPPNWLSLIDSLPNVSVEGLNGTYILKMYQNKAEYFPLSTVSNNDNGKYLSDSEVTITQYTVKADMYDFMVDVMFTASTIEIWCRQIECEMATLFCNMIEQLQSYYNSDGKAEIVPNIVTGGYYVINHMNYWCRVRVLSVEHHSAKCFLVDYGDELEVSRCKIYVLKREYAEVPAQAFICQLSGLEDIANISNSNGIVSRLINNSFLAHRVENTNSTDDGNKSQKPIDIILFKTTETTGTWNEDNINVCLMKEIIRGAVPNLNLTTINTVYVTHVSPETGNIFVQLQSEGYERVLEMLGDLETEPDLAKKYPNSTGGIPAVPKNGSPNACADTDANRLYLFRWLEEYNGDGHLYRVKVTDRSPCGSFACLYFIDYGNIYVQRIAEQKEIYILDEISPLLSTFRPLAIEIKLDLPAKYKVNELTDKFSTLVPGDKPILLKVLKTDVDNDSKRPIPICELFRRSESRQELFSINASILYDYEMNDNKLSTTDDKNNNDDNMTTLSKKLARLQCCPKQSNKAVPSTGELPEPNIPKTGFFDVQIPIAVNPWNFFIQPYASAKALRILVQEMQTYYNNLDAGLLVPLHMDNICPGKIYASRSALGQWYRTSVIKVINSASISVFYCDFGHYANVTVCELVPLAPKFLNLPYQAVKARIHGVRPKQDKWTMDDCKYFEELVHHKIFVSYVKKVQCDELYKYDKVLVLNLIDTNTPEDVYIADKLIAKGIAVPDENSK